MNDQASLELVKGQLERRGVILPPGRMRLDSYGDSPALSEALLALIRQGRKRAGTSLLWSLEAEGEPIPAAGDTVVVLDHRQEPAFVTRTLHVEVCPFGHVTSEYAAIEGEGDGSLDYWRSVHWEFFSRECRLMGRQPSEDMPVVCEVFELLQIL